MKRVLIVHDYEMPNKDYQAKLIAKYPFLDSTYEGVKYYTLHTIKMTNKIPRGKKYDRIYWDQDTISLKKSDFFDRIIAKHSSEDMQFIPVSITPNTNAKLKTKILTKIKKISKNE